MGKSIDEDAVSIIRYGEWSWSEILYFPSLKRYVKNDYEEEYLDTGTRHIAETELTFDEVLTIVSKSVDSLLTLQLVSGVNLEKEIEIAEARSRK